MNEGAKIKLIHALWSIHTMLSGINAGEVPDAEEVDTLENEIEELENLLG